MPSEAGLPFHGGRPDATARMPAPEMPVHRLTCLPPPPTFQLLPPFSQLPKFLQKSKNTTVDAVKFVPSFRIFTVKRHLMDLLFRHASRAFFKPSRESVQFSRDLFAVNVHDLVYDFLGFRVIVSKQFQLLAITEKKQQIMFDFFLGEVASRLIFF
jgi:hypothetical protein